LCLCKLPMEKGNTICFSADIIGENHRLNKYADNAIAVLESLNADSDQFFDIPKDSRTRTFMARGSFPDLARKNLPSDKRGAKKNPPQETLWNLPTNTPKDHRYYRSAREASISSLRYVAWLVRKLKKCLQLNQPRECYVCKESPFDRLHHYLWHDV